MYFPQIRHSAEDDLFRGSLDDIPKTNEDICLSVAKYCAENHMQYTFLSRTEPIIAMLDGTKYEIKKVFTKRYRVNLWVLRCTKIYE